MPWQSWLERTSTYRSLRRRRPPRGVGGEGDSTATTLVRRPSRGWLDDQKANRLRDEIASYANETAGTGADLDPDLEAAAVAELKAATERK
ncbi:MAG: hypothetical protein IPP07_21400 [Holophagales bacterium]|nr:hypothetical protein [Holophagales bacterium]